MVLFTSNQATLQMCVPEAMRGRIASLLQLYPGFISLGVLFAGLLADVIGIQLLTGLLAADRGCAYRFIADTARRARRRAGELGRIAIEARSSH